MPDIAERIFGLACDALAEQERHLAELRSRGATLLAAGAVVASLLTHAVFHGRHPHGLSEIAATTAGVAGAAALLVFVVLLLRPYELGFSVKATPTYQALWNEGVLEQPGVDLALAEALEERRRQNGDTIKWLARFLAVALAALVVEAAGFALAAALSS